MHHITWCRGTYVNNSADKSDLVSEYVYYWIREAPKIMEQFYFQRQARRARLFTQVIKTIMKMKYIKFELTALL